jgi:hypothetical protein
LVSSGYWVRIRGEVARFPGIGATHYRISKSLGSSGIVQRDAIGDLLQFTRGNPAE